MGHTKEPLVLWPKGSQTNSTELEERKYLFPPLHDITGAAVAGNTVL